MGAASQGQWMAKASKAMARPTKTGAVGLANGQIFTPCEALASSPDRVLAVMARRENWRLEKTRTPWPVTKVTKAMDLRCSSVNRGQ
jgi:hypothetical protein